MTRQRGYSVVELLIASAILFTICGAVLGLLHDGLAATPVLEETTDLHQRVRVAVDSIAGELRLAAAGTPAGALSRVFAAVDPRRVSDPPGSAIPGAITLRYVPSRGAHARLAQPLAPGGAVAIVDTAGCPVNTIACGFVAETIAVVFDTTGAADFVQVDAVGPGVLTISDTAGARSTTYAAGAEIAEAVQVTYVHDATARQLRRAEGGGSFVLADNVSGLSFEYFADDLVPVPLAMFADGPFGGAGATAFDTDLPRVRTIRATLRVETGIDSMRGADASLFARPGTATGSRTIPDVTARVEVTLRNRP
jgi:hypothetical protein